MVGSLAGQAPDHEGLVPLASQTIQGFAYRGGDLLNLVFHRARGIDELGLDLLGFALRLHLLIAGDLAGGGRGRTRRVPWRWWRDSASRGTWLGSTGSDTDRHRGRAAPQWLSEEPGQLQR